MLLFFVFSKVVFQGFGSLLFGGAIICFVAWFVRPLIMRCETDGFIRKPLGEPAPQASNLALAIVLLVVIVIQAIFNAWQGETLHYIPIYFTRAILTRQERLFHRSRHVIYIRDAPHRHPRHPR